MDPDWKQANCKKIFWDCWGNLNTDLGIWCYKGVRVNFNQCNSYVVKYYYGRRNGNLLFLSGKSSRRVWQAESMGSQDGRDLVKRLNLATKWFLDTEILRDEKRSWWLNLVSEISLQRKKTDEANIRKHLHNVMIGLFLWVWNFCNKAYNTIFFYRLRNMASRFRKWVKGAYYEKLLCFF